MKFQNKHKLTTAILYADVTVAKFIARNQWFVTGYMDGYMDVYCYKTMQRLKQFKAHQSKLVDLAVHPTEPYVMSASLYEGNVKLWDWERGWECTRVFEFIDPDHVFQVTFLNIKYTNAFAVHGDTGMIKVQSCTIFFIQNFSQSGNIAF